MADQFTGYVGVSADTYEPGLLTRTTHTKLMSKGKRISDGIRWAAFTASPFVKAMGLAGFGAQNMADPNRFGAAKPTGKMVRYDTGCTHLTSEVFSTAGTSFYHGRYDQTTPSLVEGGTEFGYAWHQLMTMRFVPVVDVQDNKGGWINILAKNMQEMKQTIMRDFAYGLLGNSSSPDYGTKDPNSQNTDLPNLISVTNDGSSTPATVGGLSTAGTYWTPGAKDMGSGVGGGGTLNRPMTLRTALRNQLMDQMHHAEAMDKDYFFACSQGAFELVDDLGYADQIQGAQGGGLAQKKAYLILDIDHAVIAGCPAIWDPSITIPYGATASTECIYGIHRPNYGVSIRTEENFRVYGPEQPRLHDGRRGVFMAINVRFTPYVTGRRPHFVLYDIAAPGY